MSAVTYAPGRPPLVNEDCCVCVGTGIGQGPDPSTSRCQACNGRGYFSHTVDPDCGCIGCREFRGEVCDECGAERVCDEGRYLPCEACQ